ncbi:reverse transcriptase domain-containing protein [Tanacetum coccineum]
MVQCHSFDWKRKTIMTDEGWMNIPIIFSPVPARDLSEEGLVVEAEGGRAYLVQWLHLTREFSQNSCLSIASIMLHPSIKSRLVESQTTVYLDSQENRSSRWEKSSSMYALEGGKKQAVESSENVRTQDNIIPKEQVQIAEEDKEKIAFYTDQGKQARLPLDRKSRKRFLRAQEDGLGPTGLNNPSAKRNPICIPSGIKRSSERSTASGKARKVTPCALYQSIKQVLNKADTSGRLAPYSVELAAYNITYEPRSAIKGQILANFINEVPVGSEAMVPQETQYTIDHEKDCKEEWVLYTDGASSAKGSGIGLILINPTMTEYTYALRLNFESTNNHVNIEALLAGFRDCQENGSAIPNIPRNKNQKADVLSKLASVAFNHLTKEILVETLDVPLMDMEEINVVVEEEGETSIRHGRRSLIQKIIPNAYAPVCRAATGQLCHLGDSHGGMQHAFEGKISGSKGVDSKNLLDRFPAQSVGYSNTDVLDLPCLLVLITGTSQSRQHVITSSIHIESCKSPTKSLFDVGSSRISIFTVNT